MDNSEVKLSELPPLKVLGYIGVFPLFEDMTFEGFVIPQHQFVLFSDKVSMDLYNQFSDKESIVV